MLRLPRDNTALNWSLPTIRGAVQRNDLIISIFHFQFAIPLSSVSEIHLLHDTVNSRASNPRGLCFETAAWRRVGI